LGETNSALTAVFPRMRYSAKPGNPSKSSIRQIKLYSVAVCYRISEAIASVGIVLSLRPLTIADRLEWDRLSRRSASGCFMQSWAWADFKEREDYQTWRYGLFAGDCLVGGGMFYCYPRSGAANLLLVPGGVLLPADKSSHGMALLMQQARHLANPVGAIALRMETSLTEKPDYLQGFVRAPVDLLPSETLLVDLRSQPDQILAAMKPKGRYNIRLSQRHGVKTEFTTDPQAIPQFYDLFWETVNRQQFFGEPYGFFINLCQVLFAANLAEIGLASWNGQVLAAMILVYWGDRATYLYGGRSPKHPEVMASYNLHWAAMQRARARGCKLYDFYGYSRDPNHGYYRFSRFKSQFGGVPVTTIGAQDYFFYDRLADTLRGVLQRLHQP